MGERKELWSFARSLTDQMSDTEHVAALAVGDAVIVLIYDAPVLTVERHSGDGFRARSQQHSPVLSWAVFGPNDPLRKNAITGILAYLERRLLELGRRHS